MTKRVSDMSYVAGAFMFGVMIATISSFRGVEWLGAASGPPLLGLIFGGIRRLFGTTNLPRWMFWWSLVALAVQAANRAIPAK